VRAAAAEGLAALKSAGEGELLRAAYRRALADREPDARLAIVEALAVQPSVAQALLGEIVATDPARVVRARAAAALRAAGLAAADPGPEAESLARADYRRSLAPYEPLPGQALYTPRAILHTRKGRVELHLDVVEAPLTTWRFVELAQRGFYDGLTFHRVVPGFVVQGGDPRGDGNGGPGYTQRCELGQRPYGRGAVGMALAGKDTGGSQFFVTLTPTPHLDGAYTQFGRVVEGMDVVEALRPGDVIERVEIWDGRP
jgi:cyclophilin family peptidyl-prolyl cis-trans isomerase